MKLAYIALVVLLGYEYSDAAAWSDAKMPHPVQWLRSVASSDGFGTWVTTGKDDVYVKKTANGPWLKADPSLRHISVSKKAAWGVNAKGEIYTTTSKSHTAPWTKVYGPKLKQISVSINGQVWGIAAKGALYNRQGQKWKFIPPIPSQSVSAGHSGIWAVGTRGAVWVRPGSYGGSNIGGKWKQITGSMVKIHSTNGFVFGLNRNGDVFKREITRSFPFGKEWVKMGDLKKTSYIAADGKKLFGIAASKLVESVA